MPTQLQKHEGRFADIKPVKEKGFYGIFSKKEKNGENERTYQFVQDVTAQAPLFARNQLEDIAELHGAKLLSVHSYR